MADHDRVEHAAILLMLLDEEQAARIVAELEPGEIERLGSAMVAMGDVGADDADGALDRFVSAAREGNAVIGIDGAAHARSVMTRALGERGEAVFANAAPPRRESIAALRWLRDDEIVTIVATEHPQAAAVIVADLPPERAARVLPRLSAEVQGDIVHRMARLGHVDADAIALLETIIEARATRAAPPPIDRLARVQGAAAVLSRMARPDDQVVIRSLGKRDRALAQEIADEMFVFADVPALDAKDLGQVVRAIDAEVLTLALKGVAAPVRETMLGQLSARAADAIRDEIDARGPVALADVEAAQKAIVATVRRLERDGVLTLGGGGATYV